MGKNQSILQLHLAEMAFIALETVRKQHKNNSSWIMAVWVWLPCDALSTVFRHVTPWAYSGRTGPGCRTSFSCCFCQKISERHNSIPASCKGVTKTSYGYWVLMNIYSLLVISHGTLLLPLGWIPRLNLVGVAPFLLPRGARDDEMMNGRFEFCEYVMKIATVKGQYIKDK